MRSTAESPPGSPPQPQPSPVSRCKHAAALLGGGGVLVLGGRGARGTTPLTDCWIYSLAAGSWRVVGGRVSGRGPRRAPREAPPALQEHSALEHAGRVYVFGGEPAPTNETPLWVLDLKTEQWRKLPGCPALKPRRGADGAGATPAGRRGHSAHALPDCMLIYGGYMDLRGSTSELWAFHYECERWQRVRVCGALCPARHRHAAALRGRRLYVHGGLDHLRDTADLLYYDTISHVWTAVRTPPKVSPSARSGHAGMAVGRHLYLYGGVVAGHATNELWRFHFECETWERMEQSLQWPAPRADCCALVVPRAPPGAASARGAGATDPRRPRPDSLLARLGSLARRGEYRALNAVDSNESLSPAPVLPKSQSAHAVRLMVARDRISVPDFGDSGVVPALVSPLQGTTLVYLDSDEEQELRRSLAANTGGALVAARPHHAPGDEQTSEYASAERVASSGFSNPHYQWASGSEALTPDSGAADLELQPLRRHTDSAADPQCYLLVLGGRESHPARTHAPLPVWVCRLP